MNKTVLKCLAILALLGFAEGGLLGLLTVPACQTACNAGWVLCCTLAGGVAGVSTGGAAVLPACLSCNLVQGACMTACYTAAVLAPV